MRSPVLVLAHSFFTVRSDESPYRTRATSKSWPVALNVTQSLEMIDIRPANTEDAERISTLIVAMAVQYLHVDCTPEGFEHLLTTMTADAARARMVEGYAHWIATQGDDLAGVCVARDDGHLYHLFVADAFQRQSIARRLLDIAITHCLATSPDVGVLTVNASSFATPAYQRMGFVPCGSRRETHGVRYQPMRLDIR